MQQIFNFVLKNSNRLLFLLLLVLSFVLTIQSHSYHKSKIISSANFFTGGIYEKINNIDEYFGLRAQNEELAQENARLKSILFNQKDTTKLPEIDTTKGINKTVITVAKVIHNSYSIQENFITINKGSMSGIKPNMGVINSAGIVGIVDNTSKNYATIISLLNVNIKINAKIKKSNHFGTLSWNGKNTGFAQLTDVPRLAGVRKGDTIVTGSESRVFPENIGIGTIDHVYIDNETNYYTLDIKLFNDMTNLGHVYVIKNKDADEIINLENQSKKDE
ncbi:rod shape-determining protein MreC [Flavobacterium paronense]|uniref:Cell shape-determining protein MreC n=1 Tax=Flavobacterium paronense TaxID=1392775 RepID=A0ABV5GDQ2_9FLAO|nr:rod shape-determining protein MreC [Flavobacterium paronense]MDN3678072.1 rod shape-determining protein MreC [Flavobacterium paronense]